MKRGPILIPIIGIFLIGLVSAFNLNYGYYFDDTSIALGALFILFFAVINFLLGKTFFGENTATRTIIALTVSLLAVYGISTTNFNVSGSYFGHWYIGNYLPTLLTTILLVGFAYLLYKFGIAKILIGTGIILTGLSQTNIIYEKNVVLITGIFLFLIGAFLALKRKNPEKEARIRIKDSNKREIRKNQRSRYSKSKLIGLAKKFKKWAKRQKNPRFNGSWAMFINKLHRWGYGRSESEIIYNFGITQNTFIKIFNRYGKV